MSRAVFGSLILAALAIALAFRLTGLDLRPMHHDEANQAVKFGGLLETGDYRYDPTDHHGPTLYYLTLVSARLRGQTTLGSLDEGTLRVVPAVFGAALILLLALMAGVLGRTAMAAGALLAAISPALTYYSRFYIQESLLVFFALGFVIALGRYIERPRAGAAAVAGILAGLAYATKETSVIVVSAALAAAVLARFWTGGWGRPTVPPQAGGREPVGTLWDRRWTHVALAAAGALAVAWTFFSSFFRYPTGPIESILAYATYFDRGVNTGAHVQSWDYYLRVLTWSQSGGFVWSEALVVVLALAGLAVTVRPHRDAYWRRYIGLYTVIAAAAFSLIRYKTPWNLLPFYAGFVVLAGLGAAAMLERVRTRRWKALLVAVLLALSAQLAAQDWRANFRYPADPRNPYVYAQTSTDFMRLVRRVTDLAAVHPEHQRMLIRVVAGPYEQWPLPWYLRRMTNVGYWERTSDAGRLDGAPVIVSSQANAPAADAALGDRYVSEYYGLRPEVVLSVYIERGLWERYLDSRK